MSLTIDDPPEIAGCFRCSRPLAWLYSARTGQWVAFATTPDDIRLLRVHECPRYPGDRPPPAWRDIVEQPPEVIQAGAALVREAIDRTTKDHQGGET